MLQPIKLQLDIPPAPQQPASQASSNEMITLPDGRKVPLGDDQQRAVDMARTGQSFLLVGKAGTGKTTALQAIYRALIKSPNTTTITYRIPGTSQQEEAPSVACISFTNPAVRNLFNKLSANPDIADYVGANILTGHALLEFAPVSYEPGESGPRFLPRRTRQNPLEITHLLIDEGTLIATGPNSLWEYLQAAFPKVCQIIIVGDINQIPSIGGPSILAHGLLKLPVIELTEIRRQALDNPIISQALACIEGQQIKETYHLEGNQNPVGVRIQPWARNPNQVQPLSDYLLQVKHNLPRLLEAGHYDPTQDMLLCPYNRETTTSISCHTLNAIVGTHLARRRGALVYEIQTGYNQYYLSIGDRVIYNKRPATIIDIIDNPGYWGKRPKAASYTLDYFGIDPQAQDSTIHLDLDYSNYGIDAISLDDTPDDDTEGTRQASHTITIRYDDTQEIDTLSSAGDLNAQNFYLGYALTVHKAQGSEWRRVWFFIHQTHATALSRELIYTAMTRPRELITFVCQPQILSRAIRTQRIRGTTLKEKAAFLGAKQLDPSIHFPKDYSQDGGANHA